VYGSLIECELKHKSETQQDSSQWRIAGGSSGGSAVAVATGCTFAYVSHNLNSFSLDFRILNICFCL